MRLGAFLQYKKYTASRHQQVGRSTCRVHPCKQENMFKAVPVLYPFPSPAQPRQPMPRCSPVPPGQFGNWSLARTTRYPGDTHTHAASEQL